MIHWINFLHIYQPPTQEPDVVKKVAGESYALILSLLDKYPELNLTMNISGSLLEKFQENKLNKVLNKFKKYVSEGRIEVTGSAMYHPILPLIPEEEIRHQIALHDLKNREIFGDLYRPQGFYMPEMAYSKKTADIVKEAGFKWIILDEIHATEETDNSFKYKIKNNGLFTFFRNRKYSKSFPPKTITDTLKELDEKYLITAHDGEMYGHWHKDNEGSLEKTFNNKEIKNITVSGYLESLTEVKTIEPREASWESSENELKKEIPYALWNSPGNKIQSGLWELESWVYQILKENKKDPNYTWAKRHYDRGIASCYWWWASGKKIDAFSPISWNPTEIEKGAGELLRAIRSLENLDSNTKTKAEKLFSKLLSEVWKKHWANKKL